MNPANVPKRPRSKPASTRRGELIDAALALFLEKGYDATSVDEIVRRAGVAKGTYYVHFKAKDDVLKALRERFVEGFQQHLERAVERCPAGDWPARLDAWVEAAVEGYLDQFALHDLVFHEFRPSNESPQAQYDTPPMTQLTALIAAGTEDGAWPARPPRLIAAMLFSAFHGAVDEHIVARDKTSRKRLIAAVRSFCRGALGLPAADQRSSRV